MVTGYIFTAFLIILGLAVMRFGSIHFKKFKEGKTRIKAQLSGTISFLILLIIITKKTKKKIVPVKCVFIIIFPSLNFLK